jgi:hypothetical protein
MSAEGDMSAEVSRRPTAPAIAPAMEASVLTTLKAMGRLPIAIVLLVPRMALSILVSFVAICCRALGKVVGGVMAYRKKANLRILIVTDYMPPQTHGIAIRFRQYVDIMRRQGHEVQVFCTNSVSETESSFDHPNLPSITNPYNVKNEMAYSPGIKLSWYLGAYQWDLVHLVFPSNIAWGVLPIAAWRRIPIYCSHHVDMERYVYECGLARSHRPNPSTPHPARAPHRRARRSPPLPTPVHTHPARPLRRGHATSACGGAVPWPRAYSRARGERPPSARLLPASAGLPRHGRPRQRLAQGRDGHLPKAPRPCGGVRCPWRAPDTTPP